MGGAVSLRKGHKNEHIWQYKPVDPLCHITNVTSNFLVASTSITKFTRALVDASRQRKYTMQILASCLRSGMECQRGILHHRAILYRVDASTLHMLLEMP
eukprot:1157990-Pelagomonas_calceolata.AAC.3